MLIGLVGHFPQSSHYHKPKHALEQGSYHSQERFTDGTSQQSVHGSMQHVGRFLPFTGELLPHHLDLCLEDMTFSLEPTGAQFFFPTRVITADGMAGSYREHSFTDCMKRSRCPWLMSVCDRNKERVAILRMIWTAAMTEQAAPVISNLWSIGA